jgi:glucosyl-3-phosphoglycerate phosphatase
MVRPRLIIAVRHGRTAWNAAGRFQGQSNPELDQTGVAQAELASDRVAFQLSRRNASSIPGPVAMVVSSDLERASATARCIASDLRVPLFLDRRLREVDLGTWEGLTRQQAERCFPSEWAAWAAGHDVRRGGGETEDEAGERVAVFVEEVLADGRGDDAPPVVVVGHGLALRSGLERLRSRGTLSFAGPAPHLANGDVFVAQTSPRAHSNTLAS